MHAYVNSGGWLVLLVPLEGQDELPEITRSQT